MRFSFNPSGVCCKEMIFELDDNNKIVDVDFIGGCPGNLIGIKQLVMNQDASDVAKRLENITCGGKSTSCPDQLSKALKEALK
ncbi:MULTISPECIES: TIGR03905 family TSCPD domain-containing protein [unclassified Romboutsia]|uniref:TIGR03905 family TSCPD domain-containing protein n=1 Tax=unclassified Romboutsia TaxID=2626894 RepID=UPI000822532A|nr:MULTISPECIES: TIGR03905 family TSCPD domain-containing protein [unclassified Romboutsia]SCI19873.1 uncharacterized protein SAMEA3545325_02599 [uncultured Clostridium sp.]